MFHWPSFTLGLTVMVLGLGLWTHNIDFFGVAALGFIATGLFFAFD